MDEKEFKLSPKEYNKRMSYIDLSKISLIDCAVKVKKENFPADQEIKLDIKEKIHWDDKKIDEKEVILTHNYKLTCYKKNMSAFAFTISSTYEVVLTQENPLTIDFWTIYAKLNLRVNTWPYFREFVQSMTQRMNVPSLTLPLFKG